MRCVRIRFTKTGRMIYVSHLDVNRMMARAVRRAELPMWYTEGFNPHPYIAFALPLSLGQSSECEYMDIRIESDTMTDEEIKEKFSAVMPEGAEIKSVTAPVYDINEICGAKYQVKLIFNSDDEAKAFCEKSTALLDGGELLAEKKGKKGRRKVMKQVNLIEQIFEKEVAFDGSEVVMNLTVAAGNTVNLNPALLVETLSKETGICPDLQYIERKDLIIENGISFR